MDDNPAEVVMDDNHSELNKSMISGHYDLSGSCGKAQLCINAPSAYLLSLTNKAPQVNKGIKVSPGDEFHYMPETRSNLYVFEAGVGPTHAATIRKQIQIYVIWKEKKILVATLSSEHPKVQLDLMMSQGMQLAHTSVTKVVYLNACEFEPMSLNNKSMLMHKDPIFRTEKEIWVTKAKPQEKVVLNSEDNKQYHLLWVFPTEHTIEEIDLHVQCGDKREKIGVLPKDGRTFYCNLKFEGKFSLSHTSSVADVIFYGYTVSNMFTVELPGPPNPETLMKRRPPKECDDPEYKAFIRKRGKEDIFRRQGHKLTSVSLVPPPLISCGHPKKRG